MSAQGSVFKGHDQELMVRGRGQESLVKRFSVVKGHGSRVSGQGSVVKGHDEGSLVRGQSHLSEVKGHSSVVKSQRLEVSDQSMVTSQR